MIYCIAGDTNHNAGLFCENPPQLGAERMIDSINQLMPAVTSSSIPQSVKTR